MVALPKKNQTFSEPKSNIRIGKRRETAKNDKHRVEMVRDVLDAHGIGDPDAPLHQRIALLVNDRDAQRHKVLTRIIENAALRAQLRQEEKPVVVEAPNGYRVL